MLVRDGRASRDLDRRRAIETVLEDGRHALEARASDRESSRARHVDALPAVSIGEADQSEARAVPRLGVRTVAHDRRRHFADPRSDALRPGDHPLGRPAAVVAMRSGTMLVGDHAGPLRAEGARVRRDADALVKDLDVACGRTDL